MCNPSVLVVPVLILVGAAVLLILIASTTRPSAPTGVPPVRTPRQPVTPLYVRPKPLIRYNKHTRQWCAYSVESIPPGNPMERWYGSTARDAYLKWFAYCLAVRCPGRAEPYHQWLIRT